MRFIADFHIHSHYSMATSKECDPENLCRWAAMKGLQVIGTGDFTHPGWRAELKDKLVPAEEGLFRLNDGAAGELAKLHPELDLNSVRFVITGEISSIYKRHGRTRKVHNLIILPDFEVADRISAYLAEIGNINADGRPILGLDSYELLAACLERCPEVIFVPAHIWTPHFSLFGANSGFDTIEECFGDLTGHIFALETGLSSDPPMNWRLSALDRFKLISNSDAHSPANLAREANLFDAPLSYHGIRKALSGEDPGGFLGTLEFFPEEGKYHYDGHRNCGVCWKPAETRQHDAICPVCGKKVTLGVLHRVEMLADRPEGFSPPSPCGFESLVPLIGIIGAAVGMNTTSSFVQERYHTLIQAFGSELFILRYAPLEEITAKAGVLISEGVKRVRNKQLEISPGFDGEYGRIRVFSDEERAALHGQTGLFETEKRPQKVKKPLKKEKQGFELAMEIAVPYIKKPDIKPGLKRRNLLDDLNESQREAVLANGRPLVIIAGPGTGKTQTLTRRIAYLLSEQGVPPEQITAVTFTNKAAAAMKNRLEDLLPQVKQARPYNIGTFHSICLQILRSTEEYARVAILDEQDSANLLQEAINTQKKFKDFKKIRKEISLLKSIGILADAPGLPTPYKEIYRTYQSLLLEYGAFDYDDIILATVKLWESDPSVAASWKPRFTHLLVDEFQDINSVQYRLIKLWAGTGKNLFVIGDPDQAIYGFRGADYRFFGQLVEDFPLARVIQLRTNYRSRQRIIEAANGVIACNPDDIRTELQGQLPGGQPVSALEAGSELGEGIAIVKEIGRLVGGTDMIAAHRRQPGTGRSDGGNTYSFSDFVVLFRTSRQADVLEKCFLREGIPYRVVGQNNFLEEESVQDVLRLFKTLWEPGNIFHWLQCFRMPRFALSREGWTTVRDGCKAGRTAVPEMLLSLLNEKKIPGDDMEKIDRLLNLYSEYNLLFGVQKPVALMEKLIKENEIPLTAQIRNLLASAEEHENMESFLRNIILGRDADWNRRGKNCEGPEAVTLMTIHAAKGLEFPVVFIAGAEEGLLPLLREEDEASIQEERRLFFVAMTRAKEKVYISYSKARKIKGDPVMPEKSRFLEEIPASCLEYVYLKERKRASQAVQQMKLF